MAKYSIEKEKSDFIVFFFASARGTRHAIFSSHIFLPCLATKDNMGEAHVIKQINKKGRRSPCFSLVKL